MSNSTHPWFDFYPEGVEHQINPDQYSSLLELFEEKFTRFAKLPAFENMGKMYTYDQIDRLSKDFANYLTQVVGLKKGDRIAIQMPNLLQYPVVMFGALRAGLIVVNTNPLYTSREMQHQFSDSGSVAIVILANFVHNLEKILPDTKIKTVIITELGDMLGGLKKHIVNFVVNRIKKMVPSYKISSSISLNTALKLGEGYEYSKPEITNDDLAFLQYTGGTTGVSKGASLTHRNINANILQSQQWFVGGGRNCERQFPYTRLPQTRIWVNRIPGYLSFKKFPL